MTSQKISLPPRKHRSIQGQEATIHRNRSSLEVLMQMGFPKSRAEKALAATGDKGVQLASDWLLSHVNDPSIDESVARDYILYLCPVGQLQQQLLEFWHMSYSQCGWNRAHNIFPHITLCSFFKCEDSHLPKMSHALKTTVEKLQQMPATLALEYFSSTNFIGLFVSEACAPFLKQLTAEFAEAAKRGGVKVEPHKKQLHISMAYQFPTEARDKLEVLAKSVALEKSVRWDLRLYSRDPRAVKCQVRKVLYPHTPEADDEIELIEGDFVFVDQSELETSVDGWYMGLSWLTGCKGMFPGNYTERAAESETWTMHRSIPLIGAEVQAMRREVEQNGPMAVDNFLYTQVRTIDRIRKIVSPPSPQMSRRRSGGSGGSGSGSGSESGSPQHSRASSFDSRASYENIIQSRGSGPGGGGGGGAHPAGNVAGAHGDSPKAQRRGIPVSHSDHTTVSSASGKSLRLADGSIQYNTQTLPFMKGSVANDPTPSLIPISGQDKTSHPPHTSGVTGSTVTAAQQHSSSGEPPPMLMPLRNSKSMDSTKLLRPHGPRQLYVIRHGERIDFTFGKDWMQMSFDHAGNYIRHDLNMPKWLPRRKAGPVEYSKDSPLTVQGHFQARVVGEALREKDVPISHVYSSPSLRCIETAASILRGMGLDREISIEPGLFEWLGWYQTGIPKFMSLGEIRENGYNINPHYTPCWPVSKYNLHETTEQYYDRCHNVTREILRRHEHEDPSTILLVAHRGSMDVCTRLLLGRRVRPRKAFKVLVDKVPFCAVGYFHQNPATGKWQMAKPPIATFTHKRGNVMVIAHAASLDVCTRQVVGQSVRSHNAFHDVMHKIPYLAMAVCQEDCRDTTKWALVEPPILSFAHTNNPKYNWLTLSAPPYV